MSEAELFECVRAHLHAFTWNWYHTFDSRRSKHGFPDIVATKRGSLLFIELKSERGKLTAEQEFWLKELDGAGGEDGTPYGAKVCVWRPSNLSSGEIERVLRGAG